MFGGQQAQADHEEIDIEKELEGLRGHVGRLKSMSKDIHTESLLQSQIMNQLVSPACPQPVCAYRRKKNTCGLDVCVCSKPYPCRRRLWRKGGY